ncbi:hydroxyacid dehydrogenase [Nesterenkonia muleiensis]|uniref:hydroxyacid dehydrogenase n=1 Tax=Nesterenkonia muleiensis TaxID=2282648 RepID=UPI00130064EA|nr:hydroxyacid dehydrogenase [Nesterenkonia muleiensis]
MSEPISCSILENLEDRYHVHRGYGDEAVPYLQVAHETTAIILRSAPIRREEIKASPKLQIIARHGVGTDNVDIETATEHHVWVTTTPESNSRAVAEHVFALTLAMNRQIPQASSAVKTGRWVNIKPQIEGFELHGKTLGLVGFGSIARIVHQIGLGFGMNSLIYDPYLEPHSASELGARPAPLEEVLRGSDIVSLHVPLTKSTRHSFNLSLLEKMKSSAILINTSRGGIVCEKDLVTALCNRSIRGAATDVLEGESTNPSSPTSASPIPISSLDNILVTPHIAGQTRESFLKAGEIVRDNIELTLAGKTPKHTVNHLSKLNPL